MRKAWERKVPEKSKEDLLRRFLRQPVNTSKFTISDREYQRPCALEEIAPCTLVMGRFDQAF
jgi:hypothetical protein